MIFKTIRLLVPGPSLLLALCCFSGASVCARAQSTTPPPPQPAVPVEMPKRVPDSEPIGALPPTSPSDATPDPDENPAVTELALKIFIQVRDDKLDRSLFSEEGSSELTPEGLAQNRALFQRLGMPIRLVVERREGNQFQTKYEYLITFSTLQMHLRIVVDTHMRVLHYIISS